MAVCWRHFGPNGAIGGCDWRALSPQLTGNGWGCASHWRPWSPSWWASPWGWPSRPPPRRHLCPPGSAVGPRHPRRIAARRRADGGDRCGEERRLVPAGPAVAPVVPGRLFAQPDHGVQRRQFLRQRGHRCHPSGIKRTVAFALVARNGPFSFSGRFYVLLAPGWPRPSFLSTPPRRP